MQNVDYFFDHENEFKKVITQKEPLIFLDYDGTLTPIVDTPDLAILTDEMRDLISEISKRYKTAIVSGRATDDVKKKVAIENIFYAGSHGFEIITPQGHIEINKEANAIKPRIDRIYEELKAALKDVKGSLVEHVKYTVSLHYRLVSDEDFPTFKTLALKVLNSYPELRITEGKKVFEIRPDIDWNKGRAVEWILSTLKFDTNKNVVLYVGDDTTDEDAFKAIKNYGYGLLVSETNRETAAKYFLKDTRDVKRFLNFLID